MLNAASSYRHVAFQMRRERTVKSQYLATTQAILLRIVMKRLWKNRLFAVLMKSTSVAALGAVVSAVSISAQAAPMTEALVQDYAAAMKASANGQSINQVSRLVSDDALISLSRRGKSTSLDKAAYLNLLKNSWDDTSNYSYDIKVDNVVITGEQAKANFTTNESWVKDGREVSFVTRSRVTLGLSTGDAVLLRAVSQVTIN